MSGERLEHVLDPREDLRLLLGNLLRTRHVCQPLRTCEATEDGDVVRRRMQAAGLSILGLRTRGELLGHVECDRLGPGPCLNQLSPLIADELIDGRGPLLDLLGRLRTRRWLFVRNGTAIDGYVSRSDLQRAPVRMLVFGLISVFELQLLALIERHFSTGQIERALNPGRLEAALRLQDERRKRGEELELASYLQIADKRDLILSVPGMARRLGFPSQNAARQLFGQVEAVRDRLVHANDLTTGSSWEGVLGCVLELAGFLKRCGEVQAGDGHDVRADSARP